MGHESGHLLFLVMALSGQNFLSYRLCFWFLSLSLFCTGGLLASMLSTGLDRLLCMLKPVFHANMGLRRYLAIHLLFAATLCAYLWSVLQMAKRVENGIQSIFPKIDRRKGKFRKLPNSIKLCRVSKVWYHSTTLTGLLIGVGRGVRRGLRCSLKEELRKLVSMKWAANICGVFPRLTFPV